MGMLQKTRWETTHSAKVYMCIKIGTMRYFQSNTKFIWSWVMGCSRFSMYFL
jgi:hypothetical protein